ncbi:unnamed protein product [Prorocentrum cordatum]|uniref:Photosystem II reaction center protein L n=1 Tax=Prorocentrum cordatum TaxID=2364126 RepID=A0ABN9RTQ9_9DINO|nr:unnamed protein product [Polarella glacialis]
MEHRASVPGGGSSAKRPPAASMAARRPVLLALGVAAAGLWLLSGVLAPAAAETPAFVAPSPALRGPARSTLAGAELERAVPAVALRALPEPKPNEEMLPVDLNRTSLYWGLLTICILSVLFSSYLFN